MISKMRTSELAQARGPRGPRGCEFVFDNVGRCVAPLRIMLELSYDNSCVTHDDVILLTFFFLQYSQSLVLSVSLRASFISLSFGRI